MPLSKSITGPTGVPATYWKIRTLDIDAVNQEASCTLYGYYSSAASSGTNLDVRNYLLTGSDYASLVASGDPLTSMYNYIKALPEFSGAAVV